VKTRGFTLVELLLVIGIIGLLTALLVPALKGAKEQAYSAQCCSNIWNIGVGFSLYQTENKSFPYAFVPPSLRSAPPPGGYVGDPAFDRMGWWWFHFLADHIGEISQSSTILRCPSRNFADPEINENLLCGSYGVNISIAKYAAGKEEHQDFIGTPLSVSKLSYPEETMMILDAGYATICWWQAIANPPVPLGSSREELSYVPGLQINEERPVWNSLKDDAVSGRHWNKNVHVGFVDGHVTSRQADTLLVNEINGEYRNRSPLWQP
jgi:prepilin-type N-terminal cleavage/methylation domain-containing protein/prepilin-type processing-associated H-X9-DG protein